jgi:hypothetical protein
MEGIADVAWSQARQYEGDARRSRKRICPRKECSRMKAGQYSVKKDQAICQRRGALPASLFPADGKRRIRCRHRPRRLRKQPSLCVSFRQAAKHPHPHRRLRYRIPDLRKRHLKRIVRKIQKFRLRRLSQHRLQHLKRPPQLKMRFQPCRPSPAHKRLKLP